MRLVEKVVQRALVSIQDIEIDQTSKEYGYVLSEKKIETINRIFMLSGIPLGLVHDRFIKELKSRYDFKWISLECSKENHNIRSIICFSS